MHARTRDIVIRRAGRPAATFRVEVTPETTVLDALEAIRLRHAPDLAYRRSCHHGSCGTCTCRIDGRPRLACTTRLRDLDAEPLVLEPLPGFPVQADLAVERDGFYRQIDPGWSGLRPAEGTGEGEAATRFENCIECGACVSDCPVTGEDFMGPAALAALHREMTTRPWAATELLRRAGEARGAPACRRALNCSRVCPAAVYPARHIADLLRRLEKTPVSEEPGKDRR